VPSDQHQRVSLHENFTIYPRFLGTVNTPIALEQVDVVFTRYDLDELGEKGGATNC